MIKKSLFFTLALIALNGFAQDGVLPTIVPETDANLSTLTARAGTTRYQYVTGFGAAACFGAMEPIRDTNVIDSLYGPKSRVGLNIVRMEISPNTIGDVTTPWDTPYDWHGYLPVTKRAKEYGAIIFGTPWSPPAAFKTNGSASGGQTTDENGNVGGERGKLKPTKYKDFFPWLNTYLTYMKNNGVDIDAVALQNEPDWWVNYSGCLYTPEELHDLVVEYASRLNRSKFNVKLISGESLNFTPAYSDALLDDSASAKHIDILGGNLYGNPPLKNMKTVATKALKMGKETWMTEHSFDPRGEGANPVRDLPTWDEELLFAEEVNESMQANCSAYIYWYMMAHWSFVGNGDSTIQPGNDKGKVLRRGLIMSHFAKHLTGSTRISHSSNVSQVTNAAFETSAYIKGDSLIMMAILTKDKDFNLKFTLPYNILGGKRILSTEDKLLAEAELQIDEPTKEVTFRMPAKSIATYIFKIENPETAIEEVENTSAQTTERISSDDAYYNLNGQRVTTTTMGQGRAQGKGLYIHKGKLVIR